MKEDISRLNGALVAARDYLTGRGEAVWAERMAMALDQVKKGDLSFVDDLYSRVADTCEIEDLFITEPEEQCPPLTEHLANTINNQFAKVINELSAALQPFWDMKHNKSSGE